MIFFEDSGIFVELGDDGWLQFGFGFWWIELVINGKRWL